MTERTLAAKSSKVKKEVSASQTRKDISTTSINSPVEQILFLQRTTGNQAVQRLIKSGVLQAKLKISQPNDIYEQEADRVAEQVMRMPDPILQRKFPKCNKYKEKILQAKESTGQTPANQRQDALPVVEVVRSPGQPLDPNTRAFMEPRFGYDFSGVRVHTDSVAEQSARDLNANAYTVGNNIVFGAGQFIPGVQRGQQLIAHELSHTIQQTGVKTKQFSNLPDIQMKNVAYEARNLQKLFGTSSTLELIQRRVVCDEWGENCQSKPDQEEILPTGEQNYTSSNLPESQYKDASRLNENGSMDENGSKDKDEKEWEILGGFHSPGGPYHPPDETSLSCSSKDSCSSLSTKINYLEHTIESHIKWDQTHSANRHAQDIAELQNALNNCKSWYTTKCTGQPIYIPVPEPVGEKEQKPVDEKTVIEEALLALGLSVALVGLVAIALADPEPVSKLGAAGLSYTTAITLLAILGISKSANSETIIDSK